MTAIHLILSSLPERIRPNWGEYVPERLCLSDAKLSRKLFAIDLLNLLNVSTLGLAALALSDVREVEVVEIVCAAVIDVLLLNFWRYVILIRVSQVNIFPVLDKTIYRFCHVRKPCLVKAVINKLLYLSPRFRLEGNYRGVLYTYHD